ncbi:unnamed protein product [Polarella glacialis]|uniref:Uncharacterized protein n=1 Tax=Polarella glacialis TaxID=89957 RepID=A0A813D571_POLGL|nr:unnamed protein product [Polarella glacialis]
MARCIMITGADGQGMACMRLSCHLICAQLDIHHISWILVEHRKKCWWGDGLPQLFAAQVLPFLEVRVCPQNLWEAFGIKDDGYPERGRPVSASRAIDLLVGVPEGRLLGIDWQFPGVEGGYSLLHRACDPVFGDMHEGVALAFLARSDFDHCNAQRFGLTALHFMAAQGWTQACRQLILRPDFTETLAWCRDSIQLSNGILFHPGDTVLDVARSQGHAAVVVIIRETLAQRHKSERLHGPAAAQTNKKQQQLPQQQQPQQQ